jgi:hypothetical protein
MKGDGRADVDDPAVIAWKHALQRDPRPVHRTEIGDVGYTPEFLSGGIEKPSIGAVAGAIHPDVDCTQGFFDSGRSRFQCDRIRDVCLRHRDKGAVTLHIFACGLKSHLPAGD